MSMLRVTGVERQRGLRVVSQAVLCMMCLRVHMRVELKGLGIVLVLGLEVETRLQLEIA